MYSDTVERFLRYVKIDTMSEEGHDTTPSTAKQFDLARLLKKELEEMGASDVYLDEKLCYVYASVPSNLDRKTSALGFVSHMDTSPAVSDTDVRPLITENYDVNEMIVAQEFGIDRSIIHEWIQDGDLEYRKTPPPYQEPE